jgi:NADPH:quinone reductase-like Zn-dependent oxidoreductase
MKAIKVYHQSNDINALALQVEDQERPTPAAEECVVKVLYSGVNPSDVGATLGAFPHAKWPRYTGRDYAGVIIDGPAELVGKEVWGTGGELGIRRDGSHAAYLVIPVAAVSLKPENISMQEAAGIGVPFVTAYEGLRKAGLPKPNDWVLIFGGNGKVGQAATQMATRLGAKVIGVEAKPSSYIGFSNSPVKMINSATESVEKAVHDITGGHGADIVYNTVGSPCFEDALLAMAHGATQIFISDRAKKDVPFNIFRFYRHEHKFVGLDTQELDVVQCAQILNELKPGFTDGTLKPFPVTEEYIYPLDRAHEAYRNTYNGSKEKIILKINA